MVIPVIWSDIVGLFWSGVKQFRTTWKIWFNRNQISMYQHQTLIFQMLNYFRQNRSWWRHQMETFSALLVICAGNWPGTGEFPSQRPVTQSFDVFFDLRLNKRLSKQSWGWWFETPSPHYDVTVMDAFVSQQDTDLVYPLEFSQRRARCVVQSAPGSWMAQT